MQLQSAGCDTRATFLNAHRVPCTVLMIIITTFIEPWKPSLN